MRTIYRLSCICLLIAVLVETNERDYLKETRDNIQLIEKMVAAFPKLTEIDVKAIENQIKPFGQIQTTISRLEEKVELLTKKVNEITQRMNSTKGVKLLIGENPFTLNKNDPRFEGVDKHNDVKLQNVRLSPGMNSFDKVANVLKEIFTGHEITRIGQRRSFVKGKFVAVVASKVTDMWQSDYNDKAFCDVEGKEYSWEAAEKPRYIDYMEGDQIFIAGGGRRTFLTIRQ